MPTTEKGATVEALAQYLGTLNDRALLLSSAPVLLTADVRAAIKVTAPGICGPNR